VPPRDYVVRAHALTEISPPGGGRVQKSPPLAPPAPKTNRLFAPGQVFGTGT